MNVTMRTKAGRPRRLLDNPRGQCDGLSLRRYLLAPRTSTPANLPPESSTGCFPPRPLRGGAILIANLELEFHVSPIRITKLRFSNRKYSPLFRPPWRIAISRSAVSSVVADRPLGLRRPGGGTPLFTKFLGVTPRLEFRAIHTKQNSSSVSNRYKMCFSDFEYPGEKPTEKAPARRQRYELQRQRCRPEASATKAGLKEKRKYGGGRYVYDSGGADLSCGVAMSDYDVRSSRCTLACPGCVLEGAESCCAAWSDSVYRSTWWL